MTQLDDTITFPTIPDQLLSNDRFRESMVKASAYYTIALETANIDHSRDETAAAVTDAQYNLEEKDTPEEYIELLIPELSVAVEEANRERQNKFANKLEQTRQQFKDMVSSF